MSIQHERVLQALGQTREWYTQKQLMDALGMASSDTSNALKALLAERKIQRLKPPPGFAKGVRFIYAAHDVAPPQSADIELPPKLKGFRAEARARRKKHRLAKNRKLNEMRGKSKAVVRPANVPEPRWAFTSDGCPILLDTGAEIPRNAVEALARFVRRLEASHP